VERGPGLREYGHPAPDHTQDAESLAGLYAFGILDGADLARFERHLAACGRCAEVVAGDRAIVSTVGLTAPEVDPQAGFKERLLQAAAAEIAERTDPSSAGAGSGGGAGRIVPFRARRTGAVPLSWLLPLAAIFVALLVGAGLIGRQINQAQVVATTALENRESRGRAELIVRRSGEGVIQLSGLEDLRDGRVYQAWVIRPGSPPVATGASTNGDGTLTLDGDVRGARVAVTLEPGPGATVPSVRPFLVGDAPA
jgi:anti-sigma-K factor RskA